MRICSGPAPVKRVLFLSMLFMLAGGVAGISPANTLEKTRGIRVVAKPADGTDKTIRLYSGYHALVIGCGDYRNGWPRLRNAVKVYFQHQSGRPLKLYSGKGGGTSAADYYCRG